MTEEEARKLYLKRVCFLRNNVAPDDIYEFAEQALACADFFLNKWNEWEDIAKEVDNNTDAGQWIKNLVGLRILEKQNYLGGIAVNSTFKDPK